jgi:hypothetical protein
MTENAQKLRGVMLVLTGLQFASLEGLLDFIASLLLTGTLTITDAFDPELTGTVTFLHGLPVKDGRVYYSLESVPFRKPGIGVMKEVPISCLGDGKNYTFSFQLGDESGVA